MEFIHFMIPWLILLGFWCISKPNVWTDKDGTTHVRTRARRGGGW